MRKKGVKVQHQSCINMQLRQIRNGRRFDIVEAGINNFIENWKNSERAFVDYFTENYVTRKEQWALCYRD